MVPDGYVVNLRVVAKADNAVAAHKSRLLIGPHIVSVGVEIVWQEYFTLSHSAL